jgi:hypothetical protein
MMNWNAILESVLSIVLPPLAASLVALAVAWINKESKKLSADQMYAIKEAVSIGVNFAEQTGLTKTGEQKKADAIAAAQAYLDKQGVKVDLSLLDAMVESAVKTELGWDKFTLVAPPEPTTPPASMVDPAKPVG